MSNNQENQTKTHFDLHARVIGYVSRIREVKPTKGKKFLACSILAMRQDDGATEMRFTYFDVKVVGQEAEDLLSSLKSKIDSGKHLFIEARLGDLYVHDYTQDDSTNVQLCMKARLLKVLAHEVHDERQEAQMAQKYGAKITVRGLGYLNRVNSGRYASISAFHGEMDSVTYLSVDAIARGEQVKAALPPLGSAAKAEKTVLIGFEVDNIYPDSFVYSRGQHTGTRGLVVKGQLSRISMAKIDGVAVVLGQADQRNGTDN